MDLVVLEKHPLAVEDQHTVVTGGPDVTAEELDAGERTGRVLVAEDHASSA